MFYKLCYTEGHFLCTLSPHALGLSCVFCPHQLLPQCCLVSTCNKHLVKPLEKSLPACQRQTCRMLVTVWDYKEDGCSCTQRSVKGQIPSQANEDCREKIKDMNKANCPFWQSNWGNACFLAAPLRLAKALPSPKHC